MKQNLSFVLIRLIGLSMLILAFVSVASASWKEQVLYSFQGGNDGEVPAGAVVFDKRGNLYGTTVGGGADNCAPIAACGTVFELSPPAKKGDPWTETVLYVFKGKVYNDGDTPGGGLVLDAAGNLYGATEYGGAGDCVLLGTKAGCGTVFEMSPPVQKGGAWTETILYSFQSGKDGYVPQGNLTFDKSGNLYGATYFGGGKGNTCNPYFQYCGTVFKLSPPKQKGGQWTEKVLHSFGSGNDGANPNGGLLFDSKGAIYGTTWAGGSSSNPDCKTNIDVGCGTIFKLSPPKTKGGKWSEKLLYSFQGPSKDGAGPDGGLIFDAKHALYGTTVGGGSQGDGIVFQLLAAKGGSWLETSLHTFSNANDGSAPMAGLFLDKAGNLFGTAALGDTYGGGTVFELKPATGGSWTFAVLHEFTGAPDGSYPASRLVAGKGGNLYGTTEQSGNTGQNCGNYGCGTVFEVSP